MKNETRIVTITAARTYVGQTTVELPAFCRDDRFRGLVVTGGAITKFLAERMTFGRLQGTGLACPVITDARAKGAEGIIAEVTLADIAAALRSDGFLF